MKREYTFELRSIHPDYKIVTPKELDKRLGKTFKLIGNIVVGNKLEMHFEDGFIFKTSALEIEGYIHDRRNGLDFITLLTKDMAFELDYSNRNIKVNLEEQLSLL